MLTTWCVYFPLHGRGCGDNFLRGTWLLCYSLCVSEIRDLVGKRSRTASTVKTFVHPIKFLSSKSPVNLRWMPPESLPVGTGGGGGSSDFQPVGVGGTSVLSGLWDWASSLRFSPWAHIIRPQWAHDQLPKSTHPDLLKISRHTNEGGGTEANSKGNEGGGQER